MSNDDLNGIRKHLASPDVSLSKHIRHQQHELGRSLENRKAIYLDQKFWIILRDVAIGRRNSSDELALLTCLKELVAAGIAFCPISESTFMELLKQEDLATRTATAQLIDELSLGISLLAYDERLQLELKHLIQTKGGKSDLVPMRYSVWTKLSYVLGHMHPTQTGFDTATELALQKAFFDKMWIFPMSEIVSTLNDSMPPDMAFEDLARKLNAGNSAHAHELKSFQHTFTIELKGILNLIAPVAAGIVTRIAEAATGRTLSREGQEWSELVQQWHDFLLEGLKSDEFKNALRTMYIETCLHASVRWNTSQQFKANDFYDFHHAAAALGYCDVFLTERGLKSMVTASHLALDARYGCQVVSNIKDALIILSDLH